MKEEWKTQILDEVCLKITDGSHYSPKTIGAGFPYITVKDIGKDNDLIDFENCKFIGENDYRDLVKNGCKPIVGDVLFSKDGTVGKVSLVDYDQDFVVLSSLAIIRPNSKIIDSKYLKYIFKAPFFLQQAIGKKTGVAIRRIVLKNLKTIPVPFPLLLEQKRIVAILDEAFEGIDRAVANTEKNLANARELFESYLNKVFTEKGEGWMETTIEEVCTLRSGTTVSKSLERESGDIPYLKVADMSFMGNETSVYSSSRFLNVSEISSRSVLPIGTVLFPKRGGAIATNKKRITAVQVAVDLNIMGVIPSQRIYPEFLFFYFQQFDLASIGSGSSIPQINNYDIEPLKINFPKSIDKQQEITESLQAIQTEANALEAIYRKKLSALTELKQSLLQKAFSGELTANDTAINEGAVA
jgi:type I restriction enzyme, S subunit